jgi:hypothetical protein
VLYLSYVYLVTKTDAKAHQVLNEAPLIWLFLAGVTMIAITLVVFRTSNEGDPNQTYRPPVFKDGKIVPGEVK